MRICLVHSSATTGSGSGRYILDLALRFAEDRHQVTLCCHESAEALVGKPNIRVVTVPRLSGRWGTWRLGHLAQLWALRRQVPALLEGSEFDVLLGSDLLFLDSLRARRGSSLPLIYTPLSMIAPVEIASYELRGLRSLIGVRLYAALQRRTLQECERVVRFTVSAVRALESYYHLDLSNKQLVSVYVSREFESDLGRAPNASLPFERPEPRELLWVGRLVRSKNVDFLLRAAAQLKSDNWILNICNDGPERQSLERLAATLGIAEKVRFLGHVDDLAANYRRASVLLTASVLEQYSLTVMEAYAFGVPCIGLMPNWKTVFNSNVDQITDGVTGFVVSDEAQMASRIDCLLADETLRLTMARQAYARKQSGFSFEAFYRDLCQAVGTAVVTGPAIASARHSPRRQPTARVNDTKT